MKTLIIIQARVGSSRLPNKVMLPLAGAPLLQRMVERVQMAPGKFELVIATTSEPSEEPVRLVCKTLRVKCFNGHPTDLLDRHYNAAKELKADVVVKIPSDCPLIDPAIIGRVLRFFEEAGGRFGYVSNLHPATYPDGNDVEVMPFSVLETAYHEATKNYEREHTTPFIWEHPERFKIGNVMWESGLDFSMSHRWTVDYPEDYEIIKRVYDELWSEAHPDFTMYEILSLLDAKPEIANINAQYLGVNWYRHHIGELKTISEKETKRLVDV